MASRDRSQGFGFVYVDVKKLLEQTEAVAKNPETHPQEKTALSVHLPKTNLAAVPTAPAAPAAEIKAEAPKAPPVEDRIRQIKENLDRLQSLHHKLHAVLEELSSVSRKKKTP